MAAVVLSMEVRPRTITTPAELPKVGDAESRVLDFKAVVPPTQRFEPAKDVAALANAMGGAIIVGAVENPVPGPLHVYRPLSEADADETVRVYEEAVRDLCRPQPLVGPERIRVGPPDFPAEGIVLAVNVEPAMAQPVAVRVQRDEISQAEYRAESWCFPIRVGTQTAYLSPEVLPMYMLAHVRRTFLLLCAIPIGASVKIARAVHNGEFTYQKASFSGADEQRNIVNVGSFNIALDRIESVYHDGTTWIIICPY